MIISDVLPVMVDDGLLSSHPIIVDVSSPAEITSVFDSISYSKVGLLANLLLLRWKYTQKNLSSFFQTCLSLTR